MNCLAENSDVKANSPRVFLFFIYSLFHTEFCRFDVRYNNISVSISSPESDSELRAMNSAIAHFARLQETTSQCALTLSRSVSRAASPCPASACVSMCARPNGRPIRWAEHLTMSVLPGCSHTGIAESVRAGT